MSGDDYRPTLGGALRSAHEVVESSLEADRQRAAEGKAREEAERFGRECLCATCFHAPVCSVNLAAQTMAAAHGIDVASGEAGLVVIGRCAHYTELPSAPAPEPAG